MMKKKKSRDGGLVYSTNPDFVPSGEEEQAEYSSALPSQQSLRIYLDRIGGGKLISRITGFQMPDEAMDELARELKQKCGVGGNVKNGDILIQGDHREKLEKMLREKGFPVKKAGG
ncbi:MAG: translation initiation factor [Bacteroidia bacterium]|nr:translation initiation factor [Bacteroidia bacterium]